VTETKREEEVAVFLFPRRSAKVGVLPRAMDLKAGGRESESRWSHLTRSFIHTYTPPTHTYKRVLRGFKVCSSFSALAILQLASLLEGSDLGLWREVSWNNCHQSAFCHPFPMLTTFFGTESFYVVDAVYVEGIASPPLPPQLFTTRQTRSGTVFAAWIGNITWALGMAAWWSSQCVPACVLQCRR
jgi:hypothetical protein